MRVSTMLALAGAFIAGVYAAPVTEAPEAKKRGNYYGGSVYQDLNFGGLREDMYVDDDTCHALGSALQDAASSLKVYDGSTCNLYNAYGCGEGEGWVVFRGPTDQSALAPSFQDKISSYKCFDS
ncbi:hypothetical protein BU16DRAFT_556034 [Lophium mytilinum]|uniref:Beta/gamma crystallin 'Greek key' domain-containing protein n=1 Tax=Lophium mytilinum TaxID=390894 RepID=A0A6A6RAT4_9PEZI|nr:hypothetical protein BU16DRAFT_556034 [Lophium mytilinum]